MRLIIKYTNLSATPAIDAYVDQKIGTLKKFFVDWEKTREVLVEVELARTTHHHNKGDVFYAEVNIDTPVKLLRATHKDWDLRVAIDQVKDQLQREIKKFNAKGRPQDSRGQEKLRKLRGK